MEKTYSINLWTFIKLKQKALRVLLLIMLCAVSALAQQSKVINGTVTDDKNMPLPGVVVTARSSGRSTSSDPNGKFSIQVNGPDDLIRFSFLGFVSKEVPAGASNV